MPPIEPVKPAEGQESVWDYPRPPRVERVMHRLRIVFNAVVIADTVNAYRVLETSHPPAYYLPPTDLQMQYFTQINRRTFCEFKGAASYWTIQVGDKVAEAAAWGYLQPSPGFEAITGYLSFYAGRMDACYVGDEQVQPQAGDFYGGWITSNVVGPFKGAAGTWGW